MTGCSAPLRDVGAGMVEELMGPPLEHLMGIVPQATGYLAEVIGGAIATAVLLAVRRWYQKRKGKR